MAEFYVFPSEADARDALACINESIPFRQALAQYGYRLDGQIIEQGSYRMLQWASEPLPLVNGEWVIPSLRPVIVRLNEWNALYNIPERTPEEVEARCRLLEQSCTLPIPGPAPAALRDVDE